jgi:hypothetical protein
MEHPRDFARPNHGYTRAVSRWTSSVLSHLQPLPATTRRPTVSQMCSLSTDARYLLSDNNLSVYSKRTSGFGWLLIQRGLLSSAYGIQ